MSEKPRLYVVPDVPTDDHDPSKPEAEGKITGIPTPETLDPKGRLILQPDKQDGVPDFETATPADLGPEFVETEEGSEEASVQNHPSNLPKGN